MKITPVQSEGLNMSEKLGYFGGVSERIRKGFVKTSQLGSQ